MKFPLTSTHLQFSTNRNLGRNPEDCSVSFFDALLVENIPVLFYWYPRNFMFVHTLVTCTWISLDWTIIHKRALSILLLITHQERSVNRLEIAELHIHCASVVTPIEDEHTGFQSIDPNSQNWRWGILRSFYVYDTRFLLERRSLPN